MSITGFLIRVKHRYPVLWRGIDVSNGLLVAALHGRVLARSAQAAIQSAGSQSLRVRVLKTSDVDSLIEFFERQPLARLTHFRPHGFDAGALSQVLRNPGIVAFGVFPETDQKRLVGYFFLRCFANKRSFVGRILDSSVDGKGLGRVMNQIMYQTAWQAGFRCMTTVSVSNEMVMRSHRNNPHARFVRKLPNDYLLIEFLPNVPEEEQLNSFGR